MGGAESFRNRHELMFHRDGGRSPAKAIYSLVVRPKSPHVRGAVDEERGVQREHLPELGGDQVGDQQVFAPQPPRYNGGQRVRQDERQRRVQSVLPHDHPVGLHVGHVHGVHLRLERRMGHHQRPSDVRVEEPAV